MEEEGEEPITHIVTEFITGSIYISRVQVQSGAISVKGKGRSRKRHLVNVRNLPEKKEGEK